MEKLAQPPTWEEIESHGRFGDLTPDERAVVARAWGERVSAYGIQEHGQKDQALVEFLAATRAKVQRIEEDLTLGERARYSGKTFANALARTGTSIAHTAGKLLESRRLPPHRNGDFFGLGASEPGGPIEITDEEVASLAPTRAGAALAEKAEEVQATADEFYATDRRFSGTFNEALASGAGTLVGIAGTGGAARILGATPKLATAVAAATGSSLEANAQYLDAVAHGADEETAMKAWAMGAAIGTSESLPFAKPLAGLLSKLDRASGGRVRNVIRDAVTGGATEALQEFFQTTAGNEVARRLYDEDRERWEGAGMAAGAGGVLGAVMGAIVKSGGRRTQPSRPAPEPALEVNATVSGEPSQPAAAPVPVTATDVPAGAGMTFDLRQPTPGTSQTGTAPTQPEPRPQTTDPAGSEDGPRPAAATSQTETSAPAQNLGPGAASQREWRDRAYPSRVFSDERMSQRIREMGSPDAYIPISNQDTQEEVNAKLAEMGPITAADALISGEFGGLEPRLQVGLGMQLTQNLSEAITAAEAAGSAATAHELTLLNDEVVRELGAVGTELGQGVQAFAMWKRMSPEGILMDWDKARAAAEAPPMSPETRSEANDLKDRINASPQGSFIREQLTRDLLDLLGREEKIPVSEVLTSFWYANILAGLGTHGVNVVGSASHILARTAARGLVSHPRDVLALLRGMASRSTQKQALATAWQGLVHGRPATKSAGKYESAPDLRDPRRSSPLHLLYSKEKPAYHPKNLLTLGRYVFNALNAADSYFFTTAKQGMERMTASRLARARVKASNGDVTYPQAIAEELHNSTEEWRAAEAQARDELATSLPDRKRGDVVRRAAEIIESKRSAEIRRDGERWGELTTFTNEPKGAVGLLAWLANQAVAKVAVEIPKTKLGTKLFKNSRMRLEGSRIEPGRPVFPFVNIIANVVNSWLDFSPWGFVRAAKGGHLFTPNSKTQWTKEERLERVGTASFSLLAAALWERVAASFLDDDDPAIAIYAAGPSNYTRRRQLMGEKWKPWSIKIGDRYIKFNETPMAWVFGIIGGLHDLYRDGKMPAEGTHAWDRLVAATSYSAKLGANMLIESGFASSMKGLIETLDPSRNRPLSQEIGRTTSGFIPGQGLMRDIAKVTDPEYIDARTWREAMIKDLPVVQRAVDRKLLNLWGEPVKAEGLQRLPVVSRFVSNRTTDPDTRFLAEYRLWVPGLSRQTSFALSHANKDEKEVVTQTREHRDRELGRLAAEVFSDEEHYRFVQLQGKYLREGIQRLRKRFAAGEVAEADLQDEVDLESDVARRRAKKEMIEAEAARYGVDTSDF